MILTSRIEKAAIEENKIGSTDTHATDLIRSITLNHYLTYPQKVTSVLFTHKLNQCLTYP